MNQAVSSILEQKKRSVVTIAPRGTLQEAARLMNREGIGSLVVQDEKEEILGIISERDLLHRIADAEEDIRHLLVSQVMTPREQLLVARPADTVGQLMSVMTQNQVRHIPVLSTDPPFKLTGMISIGDLVKSRLSDSRTENRFLKDYISGLYPG